MSEQLTRCRNEMTNMVIAGKACTTLSEGTGSTGGTLIMVGSNLLFSNRVNNSRGWTSPYFFFIFQLIRKCALKIVIIRHVHEDGHYYRRTDGQ